MPFNPQPPRPNTRHSGTLPADIRRGGRIDYIQSTGAVVTTARKSWNRGHCRASLGLTLPRRPSGDFVATEGAMPGKHRTALRRRRSSQLQAAAGWLGLAVCLLVVDSLSNRVSAASAEAESAIAPPVPVANSRVHEEWRKSLSRTPATGPGCSRADYPEKAWKSVPCTTAPLHPHAPRSRAGPVGQTVGNGTD